MKPSVFTPSTPPPFAAAARLAPGQRDPTRPFWPSGGPRGCPPRAVEKHDPAGSRGGIALCRCFLFECSTLPFGPGVSGRRTHQPSPSAVAASSTHRFSPSRSGATQPYSAHEANRGSIRVGLISCKPQLFTCFPGKSRTWLESRVDEYARICGLSTSSK